jgi:hypothetical protein
LRDLLAEIKNRNDVRWTDTGALFDEIQNSPP